MSAKRKPAAERDGHTEAKILAAARTVFMRGGTAGARMQEIAAAAGVNQALLHYYFRSKDRLAQAVFRDAAGRLFPVVVAVVAGRMVQVAVHQLIHVVAVRHCLMAAARAVDMAAWLAPPASADR